MMDEKNIKTEITDLWNHEYEKYDNYYAHGLKSPEEKREWLKLLRMLTGRTCKNILDVGAGTGFVSLLLAELGHNCKGLDLSENMLSMAKKKAKKAGFQNVIFDIGDAEDTKEESGKYDIVINRHLVWTLPHPEKAIREWKRVLRPGGKLIIIEGNWHYNRPTDRIQVFLGKCLLSIQEKRNAFINTGDYDKSVKESLPMLKSKMQSALPKWLRKQVFPYRLCIRQMWIKQKKQLCRWQPV